MLDVLTAAEAALPGLLEDTTGWQSLRIDYHPPLVERLYRPWRSYRLSLHRAHPCHARAALFHPHPWPSAMRLVAGRYRMTVGYGPGLERPPVAALIELAPGSTYTMTDPDAWHAVVPQDGPTLSVMVTGAPWDRPMPRVPDAPLGPLDPDTVTELLLAFRAAWPR